MSFRDKREKQNLQSFKKIIRDILSLLRISLQAETVSMYWVNSRRDNLVLENYATNQKNVVFQDRVKRERHFLGNFDSIKSVTRLESGVHFATDDLEHYSSTTSVRYIYLIPFVYNSETVAIASVETFDKSELTEVDESGITAFQKSLARLLQTYLELSDLLEKQSEWSEYEEVARRLVKIRQPLDLAIMLLEELQQFAGPNGGALLLTRGMCNWHTVLYSGNARYPPPIGLALQEGSISSQALTAADSVFASHINASPKRISGKEPLCNGATLAVPVMHNQRGQLLALVYSENLLIFTEEIKHKVSNLCRLAGLKIEGLRPDLNVDEDIFSTGLTTYTVELINGSLSNILKQLDGESTTMTTWAGMISVTNIADLRTRYRLDDLTDLQKHIITRLFPQKFGFSGIIGAYADYVYTFILQSTDESAFSLWAMGVEELFREPVYFAADSKEEIRLGIGYTVLKKGMHPDMVMQNAKKAMNRSVKEQIFTVEI